MLFSGVFKSQLVGNYVYVKFLSLIFFLVLDESNALRGCKYSVHLGFRILEEKVCNFMIILDFHE